MIGSGVRGTGCSVRLGVGGSGRQVGGFIMAVSLEKRVSLIKKNKVVGVSLEKNARR